MSREPKQHDLKSIQPYFGDVAARRKRFEVRQDDRDFQEGDRVRLHEWDQVRHVYTGQRLGPFRITYVQRGYPNPPGFCAFAFEDVS